MSRVNGWIWAVLLWIGVIFFSSTSLALQWAEEFFRFISASFLSHLRPESSSYGIIHLLADKGFHVSLFCVLAVLLWQALPSMAWKSWVIVLCGALVGSCSEFLQRFFPDRDPAIRDVIINICGTALGLAICSVAIRMQTQRRVPAEY